MSDNLAARCKYLVDHFGKGAVLVTTPEALRGVDVPTSPPEVIDLPGGKLRLVEAGAVAVLKAITVAVLLLAFAPAVRADTPPPAEPDIVLPDIPIPQPAPAPVPVTPSAAIALPPGVLLVVTHTSPCLVVASPDGLVAIAEKKGPGWVFARFVDSSGEYQDRTYAQPHVYFVTARKGAAGRCELIVRAEGPKPGPVLRRTLEVGEEPRPPPVPPVPPVPPGPTPLPDGLLGLTKASRDGMAKVAPAAAAAGAQKLAAAQRAHAAAVAAGAFATPTAILDGWRAANRAAVAEADWSPWASVVSPALQAAYKAGKLPDTKAWAEAFNEIAAGLGG